MLLTFIGTNRNGSVYTCKRDGPNSKVTIWRR